MKVVSSVVILMFVFINGCAYDPMLKKEKMYAPVEASLCNINQKVTGYFLEVGIPDVLDRDKYVNAVEKICFPNPYCKSQAEGILNAFEVIPRQIDGMFAVMLCDKEFNFKVMEDFSCNNSRVEVQTWRQGDNVPCDFEADTNSIIRKFCE